MVRRGVSALAALLLVGAVAGCEGCRTPAPPPTSEPPPSSVTTIAAPDEGADAQKSRGVGWYPNVEADGAQRLHLAWVDADKGDVRYATTVPGGSAIEGGVVTVEAQGAAGAFLRLGLAPGGAPLLTSSHQDTRLFRLAYRPADRAAMKAAGADVDMAALPPLPTTSTKGEPVSLLGDFVAEEVGFGEGVGRGAAVGTDEQGRVIVAYHSADDRLRLARRPADVPAFSASAIGVLEKRDIDGFARGSIRARTEVLALKDGTIVVAYVHDVATDARLRVAVVKPGARAVVLEDDRGATVTVDGLLPSLSVRDGILEVAAHDTRAGAVVLRTIDLATLTWGEARDVIVHVHGVAVAARRQHGWYVLARVEGEGVFLYIVDERPAERGGVTREVRRVRLDGGGQQRDAWLDLAVRRDDRPAAVWFDADDKSLKLYAP